MSISNDRLALEIGASVTGLLGFTPPTSKRGAVETTTRADGTRTFRPGHIVDNGTVSVRLQYDPVAHDAVIDQLADKALKACKLKHLDADGITQTALCSFNGFVLEWAPAEAEEGSEYEVDVTLQVSGVVTWAGAAT
jgi:hypothetical protein